MKMKMKKKKKEWNGKVIKIVGKNVIGGRRYRNKMENKKKEKRLSVEPIATQNEIKEKEQQEEKEEEKEKKRKRRKRK